MQTKKKKFMVYNKKLSSLLHKVTARFRKNPVYSYILEKTGKELENKKWIFIVGCYNSGTTLLNQIMADHPQISGLPDEGVMLTNKLVKPEDFGWRRMWHKCEREIERAVPDSTNSSTIKRHWSHFYEDKEFLVEKSISNTCRIPFFEENFSPIYFIHIVRNGYAVAEGIRRKAEIIQGNPYKDLKKYPIKLCIEQWVRSLEVVELQKNRLKNFTEISYESMTENPAEVLQQITDFLGVKPFRKDYFENSFSVHEKEGQIRNMNVNSFKRLSDNDFVVMNRVAENYLLRFGYEIEKS